MTNRDYIRTALMDGPKTIYQVAAFSRARGSNLDAALAQTILAQLARDGECEAKGGEWRAADNLQKPVFHEAVVKAAPAQLVVSAAPESEAEEEQEEEPAPGARQAMAITSPARRESPWRAILPGLLELQDGETKEIPIPANMRIQRFSNNIASFLRTNRLGCKIRWSFTANPANPYVIVKRVGPWAKGQSLLNERSEPAATTIRRETETITETTSVERSVTTVEVPAEPIPAPPAVLPAPVLRSGADFSGAAERQATSELLSTVMRLWGSPEELSDGEGERMLEALEKQAQRLLAIREGNDDANQLLSTLTQENGAFDFDEVADLVACLCAEKRLCELILIDNAKGLKRGPWKDQYTRGAVVELIHGVLSRDADRAILDAIPFVPDPPKA